MEKENWYETEVVVRIVVQHQFDGQGAKIVEQQFKNGTELYPAFKSVKVVTEHAIR